MSHIDRPLPLMSQSLRVVVTLVVESNSNLFATASTRGSHDQTHQFSPNQVVPTHIHEFDANALIVKGEMWLTVGQDTRHLMAGDTFELGHGTPHSEKYGPDGATFWVARINH